MATRKSSSSKAPAKVAKVAKRRPPVASPMDVMVDASARVKQRVAAVSALGWGVCADKATFRTVLGLVKDRVAPEALRHAALSTIQAATFSAKAFAPYRADFLAAMRSLRADDDIEMRQRSFGILARENDPDTQAMLIEGLTDKDKALLPPEKALQLLSYDVHAGAYDVARTIAAKPPNERARMEALRVLAADARSAKMFEKILRDKSEPDPVRQLAASALHQLAPQRLQSCARDLTLDKKEAKSIRSMSLTALTHFGDAQALTQDSELNDYVSKMQQSRDTDDSLQLAAARYTSRHGR